MLKKLFIGFGILIVVLVAAFMYLNNRNRTLSPPGSAQIEVGGLQVTVNYSRPSVRGRVIFGSSDQEPLLPYGEYWRLGANEATEITISKKATFNGIPLEAGTFRLYAIPGEETFKIGVNAATGNWGAFEPDYEQDLLVTEVPVTRPAVAVEQFTARLEENSDGGILLFFEWSNVQLVIPIVPED